MPEKNDIFSDMNKFFEGINIPEPLKKPQQVQTPNTVIQTGQKLEEVALKKLHDIEQELNLIMVEREEAVKCLLLAVISGQHMLMLGPAGAGKSMLASEFCKRIDNGVYFQWLLNKTSDPSEIVGPVSIKSMENDHFKRIPTGKLPEAHIAFIDECYKANSPTLNMMLPIMNEKIFYNDGHPVQIPLITMIGASNEGPEDDALLPFHDRFMFRMNMKYVQDAKNKKRMFTNFLINRSGGSTISSVTKISIQELKSLEAKSRTVQLSNDIINNFTKLLNSLKSKGIELSDRRQNECLKVLQASALYRGAATVSTIDFGSLEYVLWNREEDIEVVHEKIMGFLNPYDADLVNIRKGFTDIKTDFDNITSQDEKVDKGIEVKSNIDNLLSKLNKVEIKASKNGTDISAFEDLKKEMTQYAQDAVNLAMAGITS